MKVRGMNAVLLGAGAAFLFLGLVTGQPMIFLVAALVSLAAILPILLSAPRVKD